MLTVFISALLGTMAAQVAPGPKLLAVAGVALSQGRRPAFCVVWGGGDRYSRVGGCLRLPAGIRFSACGRTSVGR